MQFFKVPYKVFREPILCQSISRRSQHYRRSGHNLSQPSHEPAQRYLATAVGHDGLDQLGLVRTADCGSVVALRASGVAGPAGRLLEDDREHGHVAVCDPVRT